MTKTDEEAALDAVRVLLDYIGDDSAREGLRETPARVLRAWREYWGRGYNQNPADLIKVFEDGAEGVDELVFVRDIPIYSHCEHHLAPIIGRAHIGYLPNGKIIGLSKLARIADMFARRLQVQERLTNQIANTLEEMLHPLGVAVVIEAEHLCMTSRGVQAHGSNTVTSAMRGVFREDQRARDEVLKLLQGGTQ